MSVFIELVVEELDKVFQEKVKKGRAGEKNVRRPLRGLEIKEDTYATLRVIRADGSEIKLFDSSHVDGQSARYSNFILQSVQDARMEKQQIVETFGEPYIFFFGEQARFLDVQAVLLNSFDFNWEAEWWENYDKYLRGTRLVEMGARAYLFYDDTIVEGYILNSQAQKDAQNPLSVSLAFRFFVTNYANISFIGDPTFPSHEKVDTSLSVNRGNYNIDEKELPGKAFRDYLKKAGAYQIKQQIALARTVEEARALQKKYALKQLGLEKDLDILGEAKSFLDDWKQGGASKAFGGLGDKLTKAAEDEWESVKDQLSKSFKGPEKFDEQAALAEIVGQARLQYARSGVLTTLSEDTVQRLLEDQRRKFYEDQMQSSFDLATVLRQGLLYSTPYPGQNVNEFLRNAQMTIEGPNAIPGVKRTLPLRGQIPDNYDEYTNPGEAGLSEEKLFAQRFTAPVNANAPAPVPVVDKNACAVGAKMGPQNYYAFGMVGWSPGQGFQSAGGAGQGYPDIPQSFGGGTLGNNGQQLMGPGVVFGQGQGYRFAYSRSVGATASVGGSAGGQMGGSLGAGVGGGFGGFGSSSFTDPSAKQFGNTGIQLFNQSSFGLTSGTPLDPVTSNPGYKYTAGLGADGGPLASQLMKGPGLGVTLGGGVQIDAVASFGVGIKGDGAFGIQAVPGTFGKACK